MNAFQRAEESWNEQAKPAEKHREPFSPEGTSTRPVSPQTPIAQSLEAGAADERYDGEGSPHSSASNHSALSSSHGLDGGSTAAEGAGAVVRGSATVDAPSVADLPCINIYADLNRDLHGYFGTPEEFVDRRLTTEDVLRACDGISGTLRAENAKLRHDLINAEAMRLGFNALVEKMEPLTQFVLAIHKLAHRPFLNGTELAIQTELKGLLDEVRR